MFKGSVQQNSHWNRSKLSWVSVVLAVAMLVAVCIAGSSLISDRELSSSHVSKSVGISTGKYSFSTNATKTTLAYPQQKVESPPTQEFVRENYKGAKPNATADVSIHSLNAVKEHLFSIGSVIHHIGDIGISARTPTYSIDFEEIGLPNGTVWYVNMSGQSKFSNTSSISYALQNGSYKYEVSSSNGSFVAPGGPVYVVGHNIVIHVFFAMVFPVTFTESGMPASTSTSDFEWDVLISGGPSGVSYGPTLVMLVANGTYNYTVIAFNKTYTPILYNENLTVNGTPVIEPIIFFHIVYDVSITEEGLPSQTPWGVEIDGIWTNTTDKTVSMKEPNGTYRPNISTIESFTPANLTYVFSVNGSALNVSISFVQAKEPVPFFRSIQFIEIIALSIFTVAILSLAYWYVRQKR